MYKFGKVEVEIIYKEKKHSFLDSLNKLVSRKHTLVIDL